MNNVYSMATKSLLGLFLIITSVGLNAQTPEPLFHWDFEPDNVLSERNGIGTLTGKGGVDDPAKAVFADDEPAIPGFGSKGIVLDGNSQSFLIPNATYSNIVEAPFVGANGEITYVVCIKTPNYDIAGHPALGGLYDEVGWQTSFTAFCSPYPDFGMFVGNVRDDGSMKRKTFRNNNYNFEKDTRYIVFFQVSDEKDSLAIHGYNVDKEEWITPRMGRSTMPFFYNGTADWEIGTRNNGNDHIGVTFYWAEVYNTFLDTLYMQELATTPAKKGAEPIGLINQWNFEPGAVEKDSKGSMDLTNHGEIKATADDEPAIPGYGTHGAVFDGATKYFTVDNSTWVNANQPLSPGYGAATVAVCFKTPADAFVHHPTLFGKYNEAGWQIITTLWVNDAGNPGIFLGYDNGDGTGKRKTKTNTNDVLEKDTKYILYVGVDQDQDKWYIEGYNCDSKTWLTGRRGAFTTDLLLTATADWEIGSRNAGDSKWNGPIYWAQVYNNLLDSANRVYIAENNLNTTALGESIEMAPESLKGNYPNPFFNSTTIQYDLSKASKVQVDIFDLSGRYIKRLVNENQQSGNYKITWDGKDHSGRSIPDGLYFYRLKTNEFMQTKKMIKSSL